MDSIYSLILPPALFIIVILVVELYAPKFRKYLNRPSWIDKVDLTRTLKHIHENSLEVLGYKVQLSLLGSVLTIKIKQKNLKAFKKRIHLEPYKCNNVVRVRTAILAHLLDLHDDIVYVDSATSPFLSSPDVENYKKLVGKLIPQPATAKEKKEPNKLNQVRIILNEFIRLRRQW